jgi:hypothetical protein
MTADALVIVQEQEWVTRYIVNASDLRSDNTVKADPFIPFKWIELSVTRIDSLDEKKIWDAGRQVARQVGKPLQGRADLTVKVFNSQRLRVISTPQPDNANHADAIDWPNEKPAQKLLALEIAKQVSEARTVYRTPE